MRTLLRLDSKRINGENKEGEVSGPMKRSGAADFPLHGGRVPSPFQDCGSITLLFCLRDSVPSQLKSR